MQPYSVIISKQSWYARNLLSGKERNGYINELPSNIAEKLFELISPNIVCVTTTVTIPNISDFNIWFNKL